MAHPGGDGATQIPFRGTRTNGWLPRRSVRLSLQNVNEERVHHEGPGSGIIVGARKIPSDDGRVDASDIRTHVLKRLRLRPCPLQRDSGLRGGRHGSLYGDDGVHWNMRPNRRVSRCIAAGGLLAFATARSLARSRGTVEDVSWMGATSPHRPVAIPTGKRRRPRMPVRERADQIVQTQRRESSE